MDSVSPDTVSAPPASFIRMMDAFAKLDGDYWRFIGDMADFVDSPFSLSVLMTHTVYCVNLAGAIAVGEYDLGLCFTQGEAGDPFQSAKIGIDAVRQEGRTGEMMQWGNHQQALLDMAVLATGYQFG
jgi:hypothetical protein